MSAACVSAFVIGDRVYPHRIAGTTMPPLYPIGIYSVPGALVGKTEDELTKDGVPYETASRIAARSKAPP